MEHTVTVCNMGVGFTQGWKNERFTLIDRLYFVHGGEGYYTINGATHPFLPGHNYYLPWTAEYTLSQNPDAPMDHTYLNISGSASLLINEVIEFRSEDDVRFQPISDMICSMIALTASEHHPGFHIVLDHDACCPKLMQTAIVQLLELISSVYDIPQTDTPDIHRALAYIHSHYREPITVEMLASVAGLNPRYFIAKFTDVVHRTPHRYLTDLRYDIATSLIENGIPIYTAAEQAGFSSVSALYRLMRSGKRSVNRVGGI